MTHHLIVGLGAAALLAGCIAPQDRAGYRPGATITQGEGVQAFADGVLSHCLIAMETGKALKAFEVRNATKLRKLDANKISLFPSETAQVWQMAEALVQLQYDQGQVCEVKAISLPTKVTLDIVGSGVLQSGFGYTEIDAGYPQSDGKYRRVFTSGSGDDAMTVELTAADAGAAAGSQYATLNARLRLGAPDETQP